MLEKKPRLWNNGICLALPQGALRGAALLPVSFQEGRRASDTSLTQGDFPFHAHFHLLWETRMYPLPPGAGHHFVPCARLENPMDRRAWWAAVRGVTKSQALLSDEHFPCSMLSAVSGTGYASK